MLHAPFSEFWRPCKAGVSSLFHLSAPSSDGRAPSILSCDVVADDRVCPVLFPTYLLSPSTNPAYAASQVYSEGPIVPPSTAYPQHPVHAALPIDTQPPIGWQLPVYPQLPVPSQLPSEDSQSIYWQPPKGPCVFPRLLRPHDESLSMLTSMRATHLQRFHIPDLSLGV